MRLVAADLDKSGTLTPEQFAAARWAMQVNWLSPAGAALAADHREPISLPFIGSAVFAAISLFELLMLLLTQQRL